MNFRVGQKVVCVNAKPWAGQGDWGKGERPINGEVYTVRRVFVDHEGVIALWLNEIDRDEAAKECWGDDVGYGAYRFRPAVERKTDISVFTAMLTPSPERVS